MKKLHLVIIVLLVVLITPKSVKASCLLPLENDNTWSCSINQVFTNTTLQTKLIEKLGLSSNQDLINQTNIDTITELDLESKSFNQVDQLGNVTFNNLKTLNLKDNNLNNVFPDLSKMPKLETINLAHNNYASIDEGVFNKSINPQLETIDLSENNLKTLFSTYQDFNTITLNKQTIKHPTTLIDEADYFSVPLSSLYQQLPQTSLTVSINGKTNDFIIEDNLIKINIKGLKLSNKITINLSSNDILVLSEEYDLVIDSNLYDSLNYYEYIVSLKPAKVGTTKALALDKANLKIVSIIPLEYGETTSNTSLSSSYFYMYKIRSSKTKAQVYQDLLASGLYETITENKKIARDVSRNTTINYKSTRNSYHIKNIDADLAWPKEKYGVRVGVLDTYLSGGANLKKKHPDLKDKVKEFRYMSPENDRCRDGYHGEHVSGIVGSKNNTYGVSGVSKKANIYFTSIGTSSAGCSTTTEYILKGISSSVKKDRVALINISFGTLTTSLDGFYQTMRKAYAHYNVLFSLSAGNDQTYGSSDLCAPYLANVMCIGNSTSKNKRFTYQVYNKTTKKYNYYGSNHHPQWVDIFAPGTNIKSTMDNSYGYLTGTSMSAPVNTGVASQLISRNVHANPAFIKDIIMNTGTAVSQKNISLSNRIDNSDNAMKYYRTNRINYPLNKKSNKKNADVTLTINKKRTILYAKGSNSYKKLTNASAKTKYKKNKAIFKALNNYQIEKVYATKYNVFIIIKHKKTGFQKVYAKGSNTYNQMGYVSSKKMRSSFYEVDLKRSHSGKLSIDGITFTNYKSEFDPTIINIYFKAKVINKNYTLKLGRFLGNTKTQKVAFEYENYGTYSYKDTKVNKYRYLFDQNNKVQMINYYAHTEGWWF